MGITQTSNFDYVIAEPPDSRMQAADETARDAIPSGFRWTGMQVHCIAEEKTYSLVGGITNSDWVEVGSGAGGSGGINYMAANWDLEDDDISMYGIDTLRRGVSFVHTTDFVLSPGNTTIKNGDRIAFSSIVTATGISTNTYYYVRDYDGSTPGIESFKLAATLGGSAIDITASGTGKMASPVPIEMGSNTKDTLASSIAHSQTIPMYGLSDLEFTKPASNCIGDFIYRDFDIDFSDMQNPKNQEFRCAWGLASGTYDSGTPTTSSDLIVYFQNKVTGKYIEPSGMKIQQGIPIRAKFQNDYSGSGAKQSYRMLIYVSTNSVAAFVAKFDNFSVGPQVAAGGYAGNDKETVSVTSNFTNCTVTAKRRRVGDCHEYDISGVLTGTPGAASLILTIPSVIDTAKLSSTTQQTLNSSGTIVDNGTGNYLANVTYQSTTTVLVNAFLANVTYTQQAGGTQAVPMTWASGDSFNVQFTVPVAGLSSNTVASSEVSARDVTCSVHTLSSTTVTNGTALSFTTVAKDSHGGWSTNGYRVSVPGDYEVGFGEMTLTSGTSNIRAAVDGSHVKYLVTVEASSRCSGYVILPNLKAGQIISFIPDTSATAAATTPASAYIKGPGGKEQVLDVGDITMRVTGNPASATAGNPIIWPTKTWDSNGWYNTSTGFYTVQTQGEYEIGGWLIGTNGIDVYAAVNGVNDIRCGFTDGTGRALFWGKVRALAGQTISLEPGATLDVVDGFMAIRRVGNYY